MIGSTWPMNDEPWVERALCAQTDPEVFFPEKGGGTRDAKRTCLACEVRPECLDYALRKRERYGVWGGLSDRERRKLEARRHDPGTLNPEPDHDAA
jgi:WhiB family transcriptional regulator, redox-sensing transcriptional regulator